MRQAVDLLLDGGGTLEQVQALAKERTGDLLPINTCSNYKQKRWLIRKLRIRELKELLEAIKEQLGANAIGESTQAFILEKLSEAMTAGTRLDPHFLLKEQRLWAVHTANLEKIETEKKKLEIEIAKSRQAVEEATHEAAKKTGEGQSLTIDDINHIRERTFGLPALPAAGPAT